jgi:hypothetical protein
LNVVIPPSGTAIGTSVWATTTRTLTTLVGVVSHLAAVNTGLAAAASINLLPGGVETFTAFIGVKASALGSMVILFTDAINTATVATCSATNAIGFGPIIMNTGVQAKITNNDATNSALYWYAGIETL